MTTPRTVPSSRRAARPALTAVAVALALLSPAASARAAEDDHALRTVDAVVREVVVDRAAEHGAAPSPAVGEPETLRMVEVDGALLEVPEEEGPLPASGQPVSVTVEGPVLDEAVGSTGTAVGGAEVTAVEPLVAARPAPRASGPHTLTVLAVHWAGSPVSTSRLSAMATETAAYWAEQTGGAMTVTTAVKASVAIADPGSCDPPRIFNAALAAHRVAAPTSSTQHVAVYFPERADCRGWVGLGSVRGSQIWLNGHADADILAHELGHNLGLGHANLAQCTDGGAAVPLSATCSPKEYYDAADLMGYSNGTAPGSLNTALASALGLVQSVDANPAGAVEVDLAPLGSPGALRAVRVPSPVGDLYVDYRPATGRDVRKRAWAGVQVHRLVGTAASLGPTSELLDLRAPAGEPFGVVSAPVGTTWTIPGTGYTLTVLSQSAASARVRVAPVAPVAPPATAPAAPNAPFVDVAADHPFHAHIEWLRGSGITTGSANPDGTLTFRPREAVTRQAMAAFLYRAAGSPSFVAPSASPFADVAPGSPFYREIAWLAARGISTGTDLGSGRVEFRPNAPVSREAMAAFLHRALGSPAVRASTGAFVDVDPASPFAAPIAWLAATGISTGTDMGGGRRTFAPTSPVSREAMAAFLHRADALR